MKNKLPTEIKERGKKYSKEYSHFVKCIKKYDKIAIFRHITPDYDALGSQLAIESWIKDNFPNKEVICLGDNHVLYTPHVFRNMDRVNESWFADPFLAIIVDVANIKRIADPRYKKAKYKIKIDHHPLIENYARLSLVDTSFVSCTEFIANMFLNIKGDYKISQETARNLYMGIVGDSGSFKYKNTSSHTFLIASELTKIGINITETTTTMFHKPLNDLALKKYVLNNYSLSEHGVASYVLTDKTQKELGIETEQGKEVINMFQNIEGINAWVSVTEDVSDNVYRVSIRSNTTPINEVASHFDGGGHPNASGARIKKLSELPLLIDELDKLFVKR